MRYEWYKGVSYGKKGVSQADITANNIEACQLVFEEKKRKPVWMELD